jgi:hypothetical protein
VEARTPAITVEVEVIPDKGKRPVALRFRSRAEVRQLVEAVMRQVDMLPDDPFDMADTIPLIAVPASWLRQPASATITGQMSYCGELHKDGGGLPDGNYCELDYGHPGTCAYTSAGGEEVTWRAPVTCPAVSPDGDACTEAGAHQFHYGPDDDGMRRMWTDADARLASLGQAQDAALATASAASDRLAEAIRGGPPVIIAEDAAECAAEAEGRACTLPPHDDGEHCDADGWRWAGVPGAVPHRHSSDVIAGDESPCGLRLWGDTGLCELPAGHDPLPSCKGTPRPFARTTAAPAGDDPEPGSQAYADKYASRTVQRGLLDGGQLPRRVVSLDSRMGFVSRLDGAKARTGGAL